MNTFVDVLRLLCFTLYVLVFPGWGIIHFFFDGLRLSILEKIGFSVALSAACVAFFVFLFVKAGLPLTQIVVFFIVSLVNLILLGLLTWKGKPLI